jgi:hypothetical protein
MVSFGSLFRLYSDEVGSPKTPEQLKVAWRNKEHVISICLHFCYNSNLGSPILFQYSRKKAAKMKFSQKQTGGGELASGSKTSTIVPNYVDSEALLLNTEEPEINIYEVSLPGSP